MSCINKVFILGYLKSDPEKRYMSNGNVISIINVITFSNWKNKVSDNISKRFEWHRVVLYNKLAENVCDYLKKDSRIYVEGAIRTTKVFFGDNSYKFITEIVASNVQFFDFGERDGQPSNIVHSKGDNQLINEDGFF